MTAKCFKEVEKINRILFNTPILFFSESNIYLNPIRFSLKIETTENKRFLPKILLRTKIFKSPLFRDTLYYKICDVTKMVIFDNIFCAKIFIYSYSTYMQSLVSSNWFVFILWREEGRIHPQPLRNNVVKS